MDETEECFGLNTDSDVSNIIVTIGHNAKCNDQTGKKHKQSTRVCYITTFSANLSIVTFTLCCKSQKPLQASVKTVLQNQSLAFPSLFWMQYSKMMKTHPLRGVEANWGIE